MEMVVLPDPDAGAAIRNWAKVCFMDAKLQKKEDNNPIFL